MVEDTMDMGEDAKGMLKEFITKQAYLLAVVDEVLDEKVIGTLLQQLDLFKAFADKEAIKLHVKDQCRGHNEQDIIEACQMLAFTSLMVDLEQAKLIDQTLTLIGSTRFGALGKGYLDHKDTLKGKATSFFKDIFLEVSACLLYTSPSPRDRTRRRMPASG